MTDTSLTFRYQDIDRTLRVQPVTIGDHLTLAKLADYGSQRGKGHTLTCEELIHMVRLIESLIARWVVPPITLEDQTWNDLEPMMDQVLTHITALAGIQGHLLSLSHE